MGSWDCGTGEYMVSTNNKVSILPSVKTTLKMFCKITFKNVLHWVGHVAVKAHFLRLGWNCEENVKTGLVCVGWGGK